MSSDLMKNKDIMQNSNEHVLCPHMKYISDEQMQPLSIGYDTQ